MPLVLLVTGVTLSLSPSMYGFLKEGLLAPMEEREAFNDLGLSETPSGPNIWISVISESFSSDWPRGSFLFLV